MSKKLNHQWVRVSGPNLDQGNELRNKKNVSRLADPKFIDACKRINIEPTKRQASKWNNKKGIAYANR